MYFFCVHLYISIGSGMSLSGDRKTICVHWSLEQCHFVHLSLRDADKVRGKGKGALFWPFSSALVRLATLVQDRNALTGIEGAGGGSVFTFLARPCTQGLAA